MSTITPVVRARECYAASSVSWIKLTDSVTSMVTLSVTKVTPIFISFYHNCLPLERVLSFSAINIEAMVDCFNHFQEILSKLTSLNKHQSQSLDGH